VERTRQHYDSHAKPYVPQAQALRDRSQGKAFQLKKFHNEVKRSLIQVYAGRCDTLLDLACGRGGDLNKWYDVGLRRVVGVDLSGAELVEAQRRVDDHERDLARGKKRSRPAEQGKMTVELVHSDQLGTSQTPMRFGDGAFDAVSCMFALHYFFEAETTLRNVLRHVADNLKPGGHFFGVLVDGRKVNKLLQDRQEYKSTCVRLVREYKAAKHFSDVSEFGSAYIFALQDTVTGEVEDSAGSREFLTNEKTLERMAKEFGLEPVVNYRDSRLEEVLRGCQDRYLYKHFRPRYKGANSRDLEEVSELNAAFVFRKQLAPSGDDAPRESASLRRESLDNTVGDGDVETQGGAGDDADWRASDAAAMAEERSARSARKRTWDSMEGAASHT
jgi:mRNA (guanine-N7-)-methyltransferase